MRSERLIAPEGRTGFLGEIGYPDRSLCGTCPIILAKRAEMAEFSSAAEFLVLTSRVAEEDADVVRGLRRELPRPALRLFP